MTDQVTGTHSTPPATEPLALRLSEGLGHNARKLASQLQNAAYNCGYEDAHPANATTRQAKADEKCREVLASLYAEIARLQAAGAAVVDKCNSYIVDNARLAEEVDRLRESLTREEAQSLDMQRDAGRYRWLRLQDWDASPLAVVANPRAALKLGHDAPSRDRLDAMIDAHVAEVQGFLNHTLDGLDLGPNVL